MRIKKHLTTNRKWHWCLHSSALTVLYYSFLISYMESRLTDHPEPLWKGILLCFFFLIDSIFGTMFWNVMFMINMKIRTRIQATLTAAIYKKVGYEAKYLWLSSYIIQCRTIIIVSGDAKYFCFEFLTRAYFYQRVIIFVYPWWEETEKLGSKFYY